MKRFKAETDLKYRQI